MIDDIRFEGGAIMKLFSGFLLVLAFLAVSACTGDDETIELKQCHDESTVNVTEGEKCPPPEDTSNNNTSGNNTPGSQGGSTGGQTDTSDTSEPNKSDCIQVQDEDLKGTDQDDVICGNEKDNTIDGLEGDDTIKGGPGNDTLIGGAGNFRDTLEGEAGNDTLRGDEGIDLLDGGADTDTVDYCKEYYGNASPSTITPTPSCTTPTDETVSSFNGQSVEVDLSNEYAVDTYGDRDELVDIENVKGTPGDDMITGDGGANKLEGFAGNDTINGGGGNDIIDGGIEQTDGMLDGGDGTDTIILQGDIDSFSLVAPGNAQNFENITSMSTASSVTLTGDNGPNTIVGGVGNDTIKGGPGRDILNGGEGIDIIHNGAGVNTLIGGKGADNFMIDALDTDADTIQDFTPGEDEITCVLADEATFRDISKKQVTAQDGRAEREFAEVTVEVRVDKRELAIYEIYSQVTTAANPNLSVDEVIGQPISRKLRTLVRSSSDLSADDFTINNCRQNKPEPS